MATFTCVEHSFLLYLHHIPTTFSHSFSYTSHKRTLPLLSPLTPIPSSILQLALVEVIPELHSLEQVASEEHIGTMAENLMEAMRDNPTCEEAVRRLP